MKAAPLLRGWLHRLRSRGVLLHMRHRWTGWQDQRLSFTHQDQTVLIDADAVVLALGGGSWPQLGSNGAWQTLLIQRDITVELLKPSNCGFDVVWSDYFRQQCAGQPVKSVGLCLAGKDHAELPSVGELMVSEHGLEGGLLYAWSAVLREHLTTHGHVQILIDLLPQRSLSYLLERLNTPRGKDSISNWLRKRLGLSGVKLALLREALGNLNQHDVQQLAQTIKAVPISLQAPRPLAEAISSAGGVVFEALDDNLMLNSLPGVFCAGEMLDWEAPTGGYLLTACFATGRAAGLGVVRRLGLTKDCHQLMH